MKRILVNRYELIEEIGKGGMARVWKAKCNRLNRFVAIKMLLEQYANDEEFVKRFRIEAQSAASLSHPNIVSIYDVGYDQEQNIHYIVMEYIDGCTLKEYIQENGALPWKEVVIKAIQICSAIEHAHANYVIHRDIKPHNILLTKDGTPKVTDFGIARAVLSSTITITESTVGSVHYLSPEQARGGFTDEKSDIYSLGIVMYEMATGNVPFEGDNPVAVALKHINSIPEEAININKSVPEGLNDIINNAIQKDQNLRYLSVSDMLMHLRSVLQNPNDTYLLEKNIEDYPTMEIDMPVQPRKAGALAEPVKSNKKQKNKQDKIATRVAIIASVVLIGIFAFFIFYAIFPKLGIFSSDKSKEFVVGDYVGRNFTDVKNELTQKGVEIGNVSYKNDDKYAKDIIISQSIPKGEKIKIGGFATIGFEVSSGPLVVTIPNLKDKDYRQAELELNEKGLLVEFQDVFSDSVAVGKVVYTDPPADSSVKPGTSVKVFKSKGMDTTYVLVPDLTGKTKAEATASLESSRLKLGQVIPEDTSGMVNSITKQYPEPNTKVKENSSVDIYFEKKLPQNTVRVVTEVITLDDPSKYGSEIKVYIEAIPSDTNVTRILMNEYKSKSSFPITFSVEVPQNGSTRVRIYLDNQLYRERIEEWSNI